LIHKAFALKKRAQTVVEWETQIVLMLETLLDKGYKKLMLKCVLQKTLQESMIIVKIIVKLKKIYNINNKY